MRSLIVVVVVSVLMVCFLPGDDEVRHLPDEPGAPESTPRSAEIGWKIPDRDVESGWAAPSTW